MPKAIKARYGNQVFYLGARTDGDCGLKWSVRAPSESQREFFWYHSFDQYIENLATGSVLRIDDEVKGKLEAVNVKYKRDSREDTRKKFAIKDGALLSKRFGSAMCFQGRISELRLVKGRKTETVFDWAFVASIAGETFDDGFNYALECSSDCRTCLYVDAVDFAFKRLRELPNYFIV